MDMARGSLIQSNTITDLQTKEQPSLKTKMAIIILFSIHESTDQPAQ